MAITKTNFINYSRCPRYCALDEIKKERLDADISYNEYQEEEKNEKLSELVGAMYETDENGEEENLVDVTDPQLEAMLKYYRKVEEVAANVAKRHFGGTITCSEDTFRQECFDFSLNGIKYLCYIDIYNEVDNTINIIEVKATTSLKYAKMEYGERGETKYPLFINDNNVYILKDEYDNRFNSDKEEENYYAKRKRLFDRFGDGKYAFDLAVQRYFIEGEYKESHNEAKLKNINYYLAVLNHNYIYDGISDYDVDANGNEIVSFIKLNNITKEWQPLIDNYRINIENYIFKSDSSPCRLGEFCQRKCPSQCKYFKPICGKKIPEYNSSLSYMNNGFGFKDESGITHKGLDLINEGYLDLMDIPETWIKNPNHHIQRDCYTSKKPYINYPKLKAILDAIEYPIYHLDFETFPCPIPRFKGEKCYEQSPFEFSLHIEREPGVCDKEKDNYIFLADSFDDERETCAKMLVDLIDCNKGTLFAQNVSFEKRCIKRLSEIYPEYTEPLMKMYNKGFDLLYILRNNSEFYKEKGFEEKDYKTVNYYDYHFTGSYSIKKTLPVFSDLSYKNLDVKNGTEAIREYATFASISKEERALKRGWLKTYCQQDTWAMVVILDAIRKICK